MARTVAHRNIAPHPNQRERAGGKPRSSHGSVRDALRAPYGDPDPYHPHIGRSKSPRSHRGVLRLHLRVLRPVLPRDPPRAQGGVPQRRQGPVRIPGLPAGRERVGLSRGPCRALRRRAGSILGDARSALRPARPLGHGDHREARQGLKVERKKVRSLHGFGEARPSDHGRSRAGHHHARLSWHARVPRRPHGRSSLRRPPHDPRRRALRDLPEGDRPPPQEALKRADWWLTSQTPASTIAMPATSVRSEEHTSELQSPCNLVCRLLLEKKKKHAATAQATHRPWPQPFCVPGGSRESYKASVSVVAGDTSSYSAPPSACVRLLRFSETPA